MLCISQAADTYSFNRNEITFSVLRRERRASDHYHGDASRMSGEYGLDPSRARVSAASADGRTFTVIPGRWGICLERQIGRQAGRLVCVHCDRAGGRACVHR